MSAGANRPLAAVLTIMSAGAITAVQDVFIKWISGDYPFHQMQTIRCLAAMPIVIFALLWREPLHSLWQAGWPRIMGRGLIYGVASVCFYVTATAMPFAEAVALYFTMPLLIAALAGPVLGERVALHRWIAVVAGFAGIVVLLRPGSGVLEPAAGVGLLCATLYAAGHLMTRKLVAGISSTVMAVHQCAMYVAVAGAIALVFGWGGLELGGHPSLVYVTRPWVWLPLEDLLFVMFIGASTGLLMVLFTLAYRLADSSFVAPFEYSTMFWAILASYLILGEVPDATTFTGIGLIMGAGLFMLFMDRYMGGKRPSDAVRRGPERPRQLDLFNPEMRPVWPGEEMRAGAAAARPQGRK